MQFKIDTKLHQIFVIQLRFIFFFTFFLIIFFEIDILFIISIFGHFKTVRI